MSDFLGFNPETTTPIEELKGGRQVLPNGTYKMVCVNATKTKTKAGTGWFFLMTFCVADGEHEGFTLDERYNISNPSAAAVAIGQGQMARYLDVIGNNAPASEDDLCGVAFMATVECEDSKDYVNRNGETVKGNVQNVIRRLDPVPVASSVAKPAKAVIGKPWERKS